MSSISAGTTSTTTLVHSGDTTGSLVFKTNDTGSGGTTAVTIDTSQNVGIGTTSIADTSSTGKVLEIYGGANGAHIHFTNSATGQGQGDGFIVGTAIGTTDALLVQRESANMIFRTADTERMRIDSSGYLLINQTSNSTSSYVQIKGAQPALSVESTSTGSVNQVLIRNPNGTVGSIGTSGSTTSFNTSSDYRLKENIQPMQNALGVVAQLKPVTYTWKADSSAGQGFIAHELQEIVPDCVTGTKDAVDADGNPVYQGIDTSFLVATLTAAIQELKAINDQQAETINALTARVVALESRGTV